MAESGGCCLKKMLIVQRQRQRTRNLIVGDCFSLKMPIRSHSNMRIGYASGSEPLSPAPRMREAALLDDAGLLQIGGRGGLGARADLDVIDDLRGARGSGHASRGTFMLNHIGAAFPSDYPMLHVEVKPSLPILDLASFAWIVAWICASVWVVAV